MVGGGSGGVQNQTMCLFAFLLPLAVSLKMWEVSYTLGGSNGGERGMAVFSGFFLE